MSEGLYLSVLLTAVLALFAAQLLYYVWLHFRIRARGYRSPLNVLAIGMPAFAGFFGGLIVFLLSDPLAQTNSYTFDPRLVGESIGNFLLYVVGLSTVVAALAGLAAWALPVRSARASGARQVTFPWRRAGQGLVGLAGVLLVLEWVVGVGAIQSLRISAQVLLPATVYCFYMARRASAADLKMTLAADTRPPVLYLRAFNRESDMFADVRLRDVQKYTSDVMNRSAVTFEQFFSPALKARVGPFIALGSPEDYLPPEGAARTYASDDSWTEQFATLATSAACILMEVDDSSNLQWELASLRRAGLHEKLYVLTRPRQLRGWKNIRLVLGRKVYRLLARLKGLRPISWPTFVAAVAPLGYTLPGVDPGPGAVVGIDVSGAGQVLVQDAECPEDYVNAIAARLQQSALAS